jgi:hypothetical protein
MRNRLLILAALLVAAPLEAQVIAPSDTTFADTLDRPSKNLITIGGGRQWFDESAALHPAQFLAMRVARRLGGFASLGVNGSIMRPTSRGEYFPWNRQVYFINNTTGQDTVVLYAVSQRVVLATYGIDADARLPIGRSLGDPGSGMVRRAIGGTELLAAAGAGFHSMWLDPEQTRRNRVVGGTSFLLGAGLSVPLGNTAAVQLRVDDMILGGYDRNDLSLADPLFYEDLFPNPVEAPPPEKQTLHNMRLTLSFSYVPMIPGAR